MSVYIRNSLTRKKEEFVPLAPPKANIYTCGVTVYDDSHIGHARSLYAFDVIRRYLKYRGFQVNFVRNITDIDDKIINRANELKVDWRQLVEKYIGRYYDDLRGLGIEKADFEPRATESIPDMIKYIKHLIEKGYAYEAGGDVYFEVRKFPSYGKLSGQSIDEMRAGSRIEPAEFKKDTLDFALWKKSKEGEPAWESPWGKGRPGWHIECSVMSQKFLKSETLDIHAGGRDLIFPHHENEIAQAEALTGKPFAKYWIHHGLLTINSQKMAKSLGNFITIKEVLERYPADILKVLYLQAHYSSPMDFSWEKMKEAKKAYEHLDILLEKLETLPQSKKDAAKVNSEWQEYKDKFVEQMDDDFNTPRALAVLFDMANACNKVLAEADAGSANRLCPAGAALKEMAEIFGLKFIRRDSAVIPEQEVEKYITLRLNCKKEKKFAEADKIRRDLEAKGIILEDTKDGNTTWRRKL